MLLTIVNPTNLIHRELSDFSIRFIAKAPGTYTVQHVTRFGKEYFEFSNGDRLSVEHFTTLFLEGDAGIQDL